MAACSSGEALALKASNLWKNGNSGRLPSSCSPGSTSRPSNQTHWYIGVTSDVQCTDLKHASILPGISSLCTFQVESHLRHRPIKCQKLQASTSSQAAVDLSTSGGKSIPSNSDQTENLEHERKVGLREPRVVQIAAQELNAESFAPYGQVVEPTEDGTQFGPQDAALEISRGIPRVYVMRLRDKPLKFDRITHHAAVTQCLGAIGVASEPWYLAVAPPSLKDSPGASDGRQIESSPRGHYYEPPRVDDVAVFRIDGPQVVKLHVGTWHAGPFFNAPTMDFCNLELSDTNVVDHTSHVFRSKDGVVFEIIDPLSPGNPGESS